MDLQWSDADRAFQLEVRQFIEDNYPPEIRDNVLSGQRLQRDDYVRWQKILHGRGWMAPAWPVAYGGTGWTEVQHYIFEEEFCRAQAPRVIPFGVKMVGPVIYSFGTDQQKRHYLPRILASDDWWCQGYSEPGSGSDLASLQTRAVRDGDHYVVNGTKTWTTFAHYADKMFCLVRTDSEAKPQAGISFLLIDMADPGIDARPIVTMDGSAEVNMVFLTDVRVPLANRIGEENKGWTYAKFLLGHERSGIAAVARSKGQIEKLKRIAGVEPLGGEKLIDDGAFAEKLARVELELSAVENTELRYLLAQSNGEGGPGFEVSMLKIRGTEVQQAITELLLEAIGYYANPFVADALDQGWNEAPIGPDYAAPLARTYFNWRKASIYGGTNEIQKNIIAKMVLGL